MAIVAIDTDNAANQPKLPENFALLNDSFFLGIFVVFMVVLSYT